jgi:hypothetical protein
LIEVGSNVFASPVEITSGSKELGSSIFMLSKYFGSSSSLIGEWSRYVGSSSFNDSGLKAVRSSTSLIDSGSDDWESQSSVIPDQIILILRTAKRQGQGRPEVGAKIWVCLI